MDMSIPEALRHIALLSALSATAAADPPVDLYRETAPEMVASLKACARAASQDNHAAHLNVVRYVEHVGRGNYEYWINASEPVQAKTYCRTERNQIAQFQRFDGQWTGTHPARPQEVEQIASSSASCAELCRTDPASAHVSASLGGGSGQ